MSAHESLLGPSDPPAFTVHAPAGRSRYFLTGDHAGQRVPARLEGLGVPRAELDRHIGWDIGIAEVARLLSARLDAFAIVQTYSRLVIDCNRPLGALTSIPETSDGTVVHGNHGLDDGARAARAREIHAPYHDRIVAELDARAATRPIVIALHSFTPVMQGFVRPWQAGVLYNRQPAFSRALKPLLEAEGFVVGDNEPYAVGDGTDYGIPVHAEGRELPSLLLEIRQDLIAHEAGQHEWAERLARLFGALEAKF